jgi:hypothetical protein
LRAFGVAVVFAIALVLCACSGGGKKEMSPDFSEYPDTLFTIHSEADLIGGPNAQGRIGDVLLKNDKIRVIIQKPRKNAGVNSFGGNIIDADIARPAGEAGQDSLGSIFPLVNIEWTVNYYDYEVISDGEDGGPKVLRAYGKIDVYDYLDLDFIGDVAQAIVGQRVSFSNRFDDRRNPFDIYDDLKDLSEDVTTDYILEPGKNYLKIETTYTNRGKTEVKLPVGMFLNGSGLVSMLIPGIGFTPDLMTQLGGNTPAVLYPAFDEADASYGIFYNASQFKNPEDDSIYPTTSVTYSGVTGLLFGEEFLKLAPLGGGDPTINFAVPASGSRAVDAYFVVGGGSAGSVMDSGLEAIGAATRPIAGSVADADGNPVKGATVAFSRSGATVITYRTDAAGTFSGRLPTGGDAESKRFGSGKYKATVEVPGYHQNGTSDAGVCTPAEVDLSTKDSAHVICTLGETGVVELTSPVVDIETGEAVPARLAIVGLDPSPNKVGSAGRFRSTYHYEPIFGIVDMKYIAKDGTFDLTRKNSFHIEPGVYRFVITRGPEYGSWELAGEVVAGSTLKLDKVAIARAVKTPGFVSSDLHVHAITSPDSNLSLDERALSAAAEAIDVLQSTDHDFVTDFGPIVSRLEAQGIIGAGSLKTSSGQEITPNHIGHINAYPLTPKPDDPEGGPIDWSLTDMDIVSPTPDYDLSLDEIFAKVREDPGEEVVQMNHIMDNPTGLLLACGWVTTPFYMEGFGVVPLSSYADPVERRLLPRTEGSGTGFPIPFGASGLVSTDFDTVELMIGPHMKNNDLLLRSALPTWFNLLNLGVIVTAVSDSDSHRTSPEPFGMPRNFIASSVDPRDGLGADNQDIDLEELVKNIKAHKVTVSAGPVVMMDAVSESGDKAGIGDAVQGRKVKFTVNVTAPYWAWFDTIDIYANTEPVPVDDATDAPMQGTAADPAQFYLPYHTPRYTYEPVKSFRLADGTLEDWKEEDGVISASVTFEMEVNEDTWVVALARGTKSTEGFRSLFPIVADVLIDKSNEPVDFDPVDLSAFHADKNVGGYAWGFTNPIFIDVDGDGFVAKYVREGISPVR